MGARRVARGKGIFAVLGIGSCVVIALYDEETLVGGMAHVLLPDPSFSANPGRSWRFATTAIPDLLSEMESAGAVRSRIRARMVGGASMFQDLLPNDKPNIGERNVAAVRESLSKNGIPIDGESTGGDYGRSVEFDLSDGTVRVASHGREHVKI
jgi:chemotaxis protein CheD